MKIVSDRVLIEVIQEEDKSEGGFERVATKKTPPQKGVVVAVGPGKKDDPMVLIVGDTILFAKHAGTEIKVEGKDYVIMREGDTFLAL